MNTLKQKRKYIVLTKNGINKLIKEEELDLIDLQNILSSEVKLSFYEYLPEGVYQFGQINVLVDREGNITIGGKTLSPKQIEKLNTR